MDIIHTAKTSIADPLVESVKDIPSALRQTFTTRSKAETVGWACLGLMGAGALSAGLTMIPMQKIPVIGTWVRAGVTTGLGIAALTKGQSMNNDAGLGWTVAGSLVLGYGFTQVLAIVGVFPGLQRMLTKEAESGYYGDMNLDNYEAIDSVEVDRSSYQPTQDYGAETIEQEMTAGTPEVEIAEGMVGNPLDSVRQEAAMGHGVTQWFGAENLNSATSTNRRLDMKKFAASTDVGGNRTTTGDDSMANVVGGTSMADSAPAMTAYDVNMEAGVIPTTKELGGGVQDVFDTYILPSYEMPSAGGSGHGVTQWYAESNQTGFIGNFVAGAEGHGSVLGQ